jgi:hypothetical protein
MGHGSLIATPAYCTRMAFTDEIAGASILGQLSA